MKFIFLSILFCTNALAQPCDEQKITNELQFIELKELYNYQHWLGKFEPNKQIKDIFNKLTSNYHQYDWEIYGYLDERINAHSMHNGGILISKGVELQNDKIAAAVLAHEMSHTLLHHSYKRACYAPYGNDSSIEITQFIYAQEFEADKNAVRILEDNGYSRIDLINLIKLFPEVKNSKTHPLASSRINAILSLPPRNQK